MRKFNLFQSRMAAVVTGSAVIVGLGATGAVAADAINSRDIANGSLRGVDIANGTIDRSEIRNNSLGVADLSPFVRNQLISNERGEVNKLQAQVDDLGAEVTKSNSGLEQRVTTLEETGPEAPMNTIGHLLYVNDGAQETAKVTYEFATPVALNELTELTFFQERIHGDGQYGAGVVLGVDSDQSGDYDKADDTFLAMDGTNPDLGKVDAPQVAQWWTPGASGAPNNVKSECWNTLQTVVNDCGDDQFEVTDKVHTVSLTLGGSPVWSDEAVRVTLLDDRLSLVGTEVE